MARHIVAGKMDGVRFEYELMIALSPPHCNLASRSFFVDPGKHNYLPSFWILYLSSKSE